METVPLAKYEAERKEHLKLQAKYLKLIKDLRELGFCFVATAEDEDD